MKTQDWAADANGGKYPNEYRSGQESFDNRIRWVADLRHGQRSRQLVNLDEYQGTVVYRSGFWQIVDEVIEGDKLPEPRVYEDITHPELKAIAEYFKEKQ